MMGYFLLPFRFHIVRNRELLVNDLGDYLSLPRGSVQRIVDRQIRPDEELYKDLIASFFISERPTASITRFDGSSTGYSQSFSRPFYGVTYIRINTSLQPELHLLSGFE